MHCLHIPGSENTRPPLHCLHATGSENTQCSCLRLYMKPEARGSSVRRAQRARRGDVVRCGSGGGVSGASGERGVVGRVRVAGRVGARDGVRRDARGPARAGRGVGRRESRGGPGRSGGRETRAGRSDVLATNAGRFGADRKPGVGGSLVEAGEMRGPPSGNLDSRCSQRACPA